MRSSMQRRSDSVRSKRETNSTMTSTAQVLGLTRSAAAALFDREERRTGSRMAAYVAVGSMIGVSPSWVRKFVSDRSEAKSPDLVVGWNILAAYRRICGSI